MNSKILICLFLAAGAGGGCRNMGETERSAATGAAAGAVLGGIIGHQSGDAAEGAAIGAGTGAAAGAIYGNRQERQEREATEAAGGTAADRPTTSAQEFDYLSAMTEEEKQILRERARASGRSDYELTDFLTEEEKENLRRRAATPKRIGDSQS